jgi:hypothetical protein
MFTGVCDQRRGRQQTIQLHIGTRAVRFRCSAVVRKSVTNNVINRARRISELETMRVYVHG